MPSEFDLIARYFTRPTRRARVGIGDDCAIIATPPGMELAISTDTLVAGCHFFADTDAESLGHKALAVNLSDLAACGALPRYATLALTLPTQDVAWLGAFARGLFALADQHDVELIGGDTTRGPLAITITVIGEVEAGRALRRNRAAVGDDIWISGVLGGAGLALQKLTARAPLAAALHARLLRPNPRVALGRALAGIAHAAIDVSDGLLADLGHIAETSALSATVWHAALPRDDVGYALSEDEIDTCALAGGDDYELCFTAAASERANIAALSARLQLPLTRIGCMGPQTLGTSTVRVLDPQGTDVTPSRRGYDHFGSP